MNELSSHRGTHMGSYPADRPRRLRINSTMRNMVAETSLEPRHLILPVFIAEGITEPREIPSMPGVYNHTMESLKRTVEQARDAGVSAVDIFGVPAENKKDATGSQAWNPQGILNLALSELRKEFGDSILLIADTCLDEFTDHGHCGVLTTDRYGTTVVDNDATLEYYNKMAIAQAQAGAHIVSPSGMMDGQIESMRQALDQAGFEDVSILAYAAKYASAFYGPFRDAVGSSLEGDRRTYQQDPRNFRESIHEVSADIMQGADMVMVKPALPYLDVVRAVGEMSSVPVAAYQVSGEYSMITAASEKGWIDRERSIMESLYSIKRAGADIILTYFATEAAQLLQGNASELV